MGWTVGKFLESIMKDNEALERVKEELIDLSRKLGKLRLFMESDKYKTLNEFSKDLLQAQCSVMSAYANILIMRIKIWGIDE